MGQRLVTNSDSFGAVVVWCFCKAGRVPRRESEQVLSRYSVGPK